MRKFLAISFATLALFVGVTSMMPAVAHADVTPAKPATQATDTKGTSNPITLPANPTVESSMLSSVMIWIMTLFAWLVGVAAITLDNSVYYTVVTMGNYIHNLTAVGVAWRILRDIGNIILIFGFLAVGISIILDTEKFGYGTKMLPMLLLSAVLLNFSLFLTEAVIDTGNLFATEFYTQINGGKPAGAKNFDLSAINNDGISNKIMAQIGLQTIYGNAINNKEVFKPGDSLILGFMGIILFIVTAFVMFSLAFILIARFVFLIFIIILAPVGIIGLAIPQLKDLGEKWWSNLIRQTIIAPILMLLLYVALMVITDASFLGFGSRSDWTGFTSGNITGFAGMILSFLVAMGLLLAVTVAAKKLDAVGADLATKGAGKLSFGALAFAGRNTAGRLSTYSARKIRESGWGRSETGRMIAGGLDRGGKATFDIRGTGALKNLPFGGINAGEASKGGYKGREDEAIKAREVYAKGLKLSEKEEREQKEAEKARDAAESADKMYSTTDTQRALKDAQGRVNELKSRPQEKYASNLVSGISGKHYINSAAAKNIKKGPDKALEAMKKAFKQVSDDESRGGKTEEKKSPIS